MTDRHDVIGMGHLALPVIDLNAAADHPGFPNRQGLDEIVGMGMEKSQRDASAVIAAGDFMGEPGIAGGRRTMGQHLNRQRANAVRRGTSDLG